MPRTPSVTVSERPRGSGRFSVRWREDGRSRELRGFTSEAEAEGQRFKIQARLRSGLPGALDTYQVRELIERWWDDYVLTLENATIVTYQAGVRRILDTIGGANAHAMNTPRLIGWRDDLASMLPSNRLANDCLKILSSAYQRGVEWGTVETNPVRGVPRLPEPVVSVTIPTREELALVGITAPTLANRARLLVAATVGLRLGEQIALDWRHIRDTGAIRVEQAWKSGGRIGGTKTGRPRTVPVPTATLQVLDHLRRETRYAAPGDAVFASPHGARVRPERWRQEVWYPWREEATVPHLHWRTFRHYYASAVASAGGTMLQCSRWMGHASISTTADRYAHLFDEDAAHVMERLG